MSKKGESSRKNVKKVLSGFFGYSKCRKLIYQPVLGYWCFKDRLIFNLRSIELHNKQFLKLILKNMRVVFVKKLKPRLQNLQSF